MPTGGVRQTERGFILVSTLWIVLVLAIIAGGLLETSRIGQRLARNAAAKAQAIAAAEAGITLAIKAILDRNPNDPWPIDGTPRPYAYGEARLEIAIQDELGKVDLNAAPDELLESLIVAVGVAQAEARPLVDAIRDWQDADSLRHADGAEAEDYRAAAIRYGPRNAALENVDELEQVKGMSRALVNRLRPALTIHSRRPFADPFTATAPVIAALSGGASESRDALLAQRRSAPQPVTTSALYDVTARAFTISVTAVVSGGVRSARHKIVRFTGDPRSPYWVHELYSDQYDSS